MMSEDSDYTSDINFPLQHQHNTSAHQYGGRPAGDQEYIDARGGVNNGRQYFDDADHQRNLPRRGHMNTSNGPIDPREMNGTRTSGRHRSRYDVIPPSVSVADSRGTYYCPDAVDYYDDNGHSDVNNRSYGDYNGHHYDYSVGYSNDRRTGSSRYSQRNVMRSQHRGHNQAERSDSESEPMSYNSRPQSYMTGSPVESRISSVHRQRTLDYSPHGSAATPDYGSRQSTLDYTPSTVEDYDTCLYDSDATQEWYSPAHSPPNHSYTPTGDTDYHFGDDLTSDYDEYNDSYWQYEDRNRSYGRRLPAPPPDVTDDSISVLSSQRNGYYMRDEKENYFTELDQGYENGYSNMDTGYSRYDGYYDGPDDYYDSIDHYPEDSRQNEPYIEDGVYAYDNETMSVGQHYGDPQQIRTSPYDRYNDAMLTARQYSNSSGSPYTNVKDQQYVDASDHPYADIGNQQYLNHQQHHQQQQSFIPVNEQQYVGQHFSDGSAQPYSGEQTGWFAGGSQGEQLSIDSNMPVVVDKCFTNTQRPYSQQTKQHQSHDIDDALYDDGYVDKDGMYHRYDDDRYCSGSSRYVDSVPSFDACESEQQKSSFENEAAYDRFYDAKRGDSFESYDRESAAYSFGGSVSEGAPLNMKDSGYQTYDRRLSVGYQAAPNSRLTDNQSAPYWAGTDKVEQSDGLMTNLNTQQRKLSTSPGKEQYHADVDPYSENTGNQVNVDQGLYRGQPTVSISEPYPPLSPHSTVNGSHDVTASMNETTNIGYYSFS